MFTTQDATINSDDLTRRARDEARRRRFAPEGAPTARGAGTDQTALLWASVHQAISSAERYVRVGTTLPPMHQLRGWKRRIATPIARLILRAAELVTREQTSFNIEAIGALRALGDAVAVQMRTLEQRHATSEGNHQSRLETLAAEIEQHGQAIDERLASVDGLVKAAAEQTRSAAHEDASGLADAAARRVAADLVRLRVQVQLQERRVSLLLEAAQRRNGDPGGLSALAAGETEHLLDPFYATFEDHFRGSRDDIKDRARPYLEVLRQAGAGTPERPIIDLACGRGELLELLRDDRLSALGVDLNRAFVLENTARGLEVIEGDALAHLRSLADGSCGAVTALHFVEHLPFRVLMAFLDEIVRVLKPDGVVVLETPNPQNLLVGASRFWIDPTHRNPIHPDTLAFLLESRGFVDVALRGLHPVDRSAWLPDDGSPVTARLNELLYGAQDFSAIGRRP
jgi:O-antigen chain-terminating methyltransferase